MSVEISRRTLRSRSRARSIQKTIESSEVVIERGGCSSSSSFVSSVKKMTTPAAEASSYGENGMTDNYSHESKVYNEKKQGTCAAEKFAESNHDIGEGVNDSRNWNFDDDSPWQNGKFKSAEEILKFYKQFGDWWNIFPKTDNVYNPTSKWYGQEIAPGIPVIPNMARPPLHPAPQDVRSYWHNVMFSSKYENQSDHISLLSTVHSRIKQFFYRVVTLITAIFCTTWTCVARLFYRSATTPYNAVSTVVVSVTNSELDKTSHLNSSHLLGDNSVISEINVWWRRPFKWIYRLSMWLFVVEVLILSFINQKFFSKNRLYKKKYILKILMILILLSLTTPLVLRYHDKLPDHIRLLSNTASTFSSGMYSVISDYLMGFWSYCYGSLLVLKQKHYSSPSTPGSVDKEQLVFLVQQTVRETLKKDSAVLLEDTVNHPTFKLLIENALEEKTSDWDQRTLFASEEWKAAIKDIVEQHHIETLKNDDIEDRIKKIERKVDLSASEVTKLQTFSGKLEERVLALEVAVQSVIEQFVTFQHLEEAIKNLRMNLQYQSKIDKERALENILSEVTVKVKEDVSGLFRILQENKQQVEFTNGDINFNQVKVYVNTMIEKALALYDADKIGLVDYALESSGGNVVSTRCTESYTAGHRTYILFGFALWHRSNSPRTVIQPGVHPGECWAFAGQQGYIVLQLSATIIVTAFTIEHIPRSLAPLGRVDSAPKDFSVWGLKYEADIDSVFLGRFRFMENGTSLQKFEALSVEEPFRLVELKIESNHGNIEYTCLYRFRVHGVPVS